MAIACAPFELGTKQDRRSDFTSAQVPLPPGDLVMLAVPHRMAGGTGSRTSRRPTESRAIVNGAFPSAAPVIAPDGLPFLAIINGTAQWLFFRGDVVSATVSAADVLVDTDAEEIAPAIMERRRGGAGRAAGDPCRPGGSSRKRMPPSPRRRRRWPCGPRRRRQFTNLFLAGDWTDTGLPATIEGTLQIGRIRRTLGSCRTRGR